ncbi:MAG: hypothetical protein Q7R65_02030 [bacterium]|nr:hypothetical protein [bacterium]
MAKNSGSPCSTIFELLTACPPLEGAEEYKYPTVVLDQMKGLLAKYENL